MSGVCAGMVNAGVEMVSPGCLKIESDRLGGVSTDAPTLRDRTTYEGKEKRTCGSVLE